MIHFSFSSVIMTVFMSNILLIILSICFLNDHLLVNIRYKLLAVFCVVTLLRFLFPFELPITKTIALKSGMSDFIQKLRYSYGTFYGINLSISTVLFGIWIIGILLFIWLFRRRQNHIKTKNMKHSEEITASEPCNSILRQHCTEKSLKRIRVYNAPGVFAPMIIGLRNPAILLPPETVASEFYMKYALQHELYHYARHDLWLKFAVNCLMIVYWWNPFVYLLCFQVDILLEMRVDASMTSGDKESTQDYLTALRDQVSGDVQISSGVNQAIGFYTGGKTALNRRIKMIGCKDQRPNYPASIAMFILISGIYILSYLFIFEGYYYSTEMTESYITFTNNDCYIIIDENGLYDVYFNGILIDITDTLDYYPQDIKIYINEEEYYEENQ